MKFVCFDSVSARVVPFIDAFGNEWAILDSRATAAKAVYAMNKAAGNPRRYRLQSL